MSEPSVEGSGPEEPEALEAARERRVELKHAMSGLEVAAAGAVGDPAWSDAMRSALADMREAFDAHVREVEADDGLLTELIADCPRLSSRVERLRDEHSTLGERISACEADLDEADPQEIRTEVLDLLFALVRHRHAGSDLVYEAYNVDIGGP
jgi:predicted nuclease with TOPRIM domain